MQQKKYIYHDGNNGINIVVDAPAATVQVALVEFGEQITSKPRGSKVLQIKAGNEVVLENVVRGKDASRLYDSHIKLVSVIENGKVTPLYYADNTTKEFFVKASTNPEGLKTALTAFGPLGRDDTYKKDQLVSDILSGRVALDKVTNSQLGGVSRDLLKNLIDQNKPDKSFGITKKF